jgi:hypothetical protein
MSLKIQQGQLTQGLNIAQAASYATIAAQKHDPETPIYKSMARLVDRLVELALEDLQADKEQEDLPEQQPTDTVQ